MLTNAPISTHLVLKGSDFQLIQQCNYACFFSLEKKGINFVLKSVSSSSICLSVHPYSRMEPCWLLLITEIVKVKSEIMFFCVNVSTPKLLDVATSNFADALVSSKSWYLR